MSKKNEAQKLQEELTWSAPHIAKSRRKRHLSTARAIRNF